MKANEKYYRIEHCSDYNVNEQCKILECFLENNDNILFHRYDEKLSEIKPNILKELKNEIFKDYCNDILYFRNENREKIILNIMKILSICKNKYMAEDSLEMLYTKLITQHQDIMEWEEIEEIKTMIFTIINFENDDLEEMKWVKDRIVFENKMCIEENGVERSSTSSIWYCPRNSNEIIESMERLVHYTCIILKKGEPFSEYSYAFRYEETAEDYDLLIFENKKHLDNKVLLKLKKLDKLIVEKIKEEYI